MHHISNTTLLVGLLLLAVVGCAPTYRELAPGTVKTIDLQPQPSAVVERQTDIIPSLAPEPAPPSAYLIGPGDLLAITVYGRPELGSTATATGPGGSRVDETGSVRLPLVGSITVAGFSVTQAEEQLRSAYLPLLKEPWITVNVVEHRSRPLYLFGNFNKSGIV
jgi:polysaccharide export outer membrane protein